jgi:hypothetical protein
MERKNYGCLGCKDCAAIIVEGDQWGYTCTNIDKCTAPHPLTDNMVYGFTLIIKMDGTVEVKMFEKPPKCKREK